MPAMFFKREHPKPAEPEESFRALVNYLHRFLFYDWQHYYDGMTLKDLHNGCILLGSNIYEDIEDKYKHILELYSQISKDGDLIFSRELTEAIYKEMGINIKDIEK